MREVESGLAPREERPRWQIFFRYLEGVRLRGGGGDGTAANVNAHTVGGREGPRKRV